MKLKNLSKKIAAFILTAVLAGTLSGPLSVQAAQWHKDGTGWWWQENDGSYPVSQWKYINGNWYHFNASGYMDTGFYYEGIKKYYLGGENDGAMKYGWFQAEGDWYYAGDKNDGDIKVGWYWDGKNWYFLKKGGPMATGWIGINSEYFYLYSDGRMAANTWIGKSYFDKNGVAKEQVPALNDSGVYTIDLKDGKTGTITGTFHNDYANEMVELVNQQRIANGLEPLIVTTEVTNAARLYACEYAYGAFGSRPNGLSLRTIFPYGYYGKMNLISTRGNTRYWTPSKIMELYGPDDSSGETYNQMLNPKYTKIGVACILTEGTGVIGEDEYHWVLIFLEK